MPTNTSQCHPSYHILTSMLERLDVTTYDIIAAEVGGSFTGGPHLYDLAADGVGYATSGGFIDGITDQLDAEGRKEAIALSVAAAVDKLPTPT